MALSRFFRCCKIKNHPRHTSFLIPLWAKTPFFGKNWKNNEKMPFWAQTEMWYARRDVPAILFACQKSPKTVFWQKLIKNNEKMPFWAQTEMWYARRVVHAILFACQNIKNLFFPTRIFKMPGFWKNQDLKKKRFSKKRRKKLKISETCMKFREESISDHPGGQK